MPTPIGTRLHPSGRLIPEGLDDDLIAAVVARFYGRARQDELLGPVFNRVVPADEWPAHLKTIADFWSSLLLGTGRYMGRPMPKHFAIPELEAAHFTRWLPLFRETAEELCPPPIAALFVERSEVIGHNFLARIRQFRDQDGSRFELPRAAPPSWSPPGD